MTTLSPPALLDRLHEQGVTLSVDGDALVVRGAVKRLAASEPEASTVTTAGA